MAKCVFLSSKSTSSLIPTQRSHQPTTTHHPINYQLSGMQSPSANRKMGGVNKLRSGSFLSTTDEDLYMDVVTVEADWAQLVQDRGVEIEQLAAIEHHLSRGSKDVSRSTAPAAAPEERGRSTSTSSRNTNTNNNDDSGNGNGRSSPSANLAKPDEHGAGPNSVPEPALARASRFFTRGRTPSPTPPHGQPLSSTEPDSHTDSASNSNSNRDNYSGSAPRERRGSNSNSSPLSLSTRLDLQEKRRLIQRPRECSRLTAKESWRYSSDQVPCANMAAFAFPSGVNVQYVSAQSVPFLVGERHDKYHLMQLTSSTGHATYACCLTVTKVVSIPHGNTDVSVDSFPVESFLQGNQPSHTTSGTEGQGQGQGEIKEKVSDVIKLLEEEDEANMTVSTAEVVLEVLEGVMTVKKPARVIRDFMRRLIKFIKKQRWDNVLGGVGTSRDRGLGNQSTPERNNFNNAHEEEPVSRSARMMKLWNDATHRGATTTSITSSTSGSGYNIFGGGSNGPAPAPSPAPSTSSSSTTSRFSSFFGLGSKDSASDTNTNANTGASSSSSSSSTGGYSGGLVSSTNTKSTEDDEEEEEEEKEKEKEEKDNRPTLVSHLQGFPHLKGSSTSPANNESLEPMTDYISMLPEAAMDPTISTLPLPLPTTEENDMEKLVNESATAGNKGDKGNNKRESSNVTSPSTSISGRAPRKMSMALTRKNSAGVGSVVVAESTAAAMRDPDSSFVRTLKALPEGITGLPLRKNSISSSSTAQSSSSPLTSINEKEREREKEKEKNFNDSNTHTPRSKKLLSLSRTFETDCDADEMSLEGAMTPTMNGSATITLTGTGSFSHASPSPLSSSYPPHPKTDDMPDLLDQGMEGIKGMDISGKEKVTGTEAAVTVTAAQEGNNNKVAEKGTTIDPVGKGRALGNGSSQGRASGRAPRKGNKCIVAEVAYCMVSSKPIQAFGFKVLKAMADAERDTVVLTYENDLARSRIGFVGERQWPGESDSDSDENNEDESNATTATAVNTSVPDQGEDKSQFGWVGAGEAANTCAGSGGNDNDNDYSALTRTGKASLSLLVGSGEGEGKGDNGKIPGVSLGVQKGVRYHSISARRNAFVFRIHKQMLRWAKLGGLKLYLSRVFSMSKTAAGQSRRKELSVQKRVPQEVSVIVPGYIDSNQNRNSSSIYSIKMAISGKEGMEGKNGKNMKGEKQRKESIPGCLLREGFAVDLDTLPSVDEWAAAVLFSYLNASIVFKLINLLLMERSLIICGKHSGIVSCIALAVKNLILPFHWEGVFVPLVPDVARELFGAPVPFILGTTTSPRVRALYAYVAYVD